jgi:hypothetical protein
MSKFKIAQSFELEPTEHSHLSFLNTLEYCMEKNLQRQRGDFVVDPKPWRHPDESQCTQTRVHQHEAKIQTRLNDILLRSHNAVTAAEAADRAAGRDPDITAWTDATIKMSASYKAGPSMSFPVLVAKIGTNPKFVHSRTKRWGTGQMAGISAAIEDEPIKGPPSYLEVFKRASHHKKRLSLEEQISSNNFMKEG